MCGVEAVQTTPSLEFISNKFHRCDETALDSLLDTKVSLVMGTFIGESKKIMIGT